MTDYLGVTPSLLDSVLELADRLRPTLPEPLALVTNIGHMQDVKLLHFHLVPGDSEDDAAETTDRGRSEHLVTATLAAARHALATHQGVRVFMRLTEPGTVGWRVVGVKRPS